MQNPTTADPSFLDAVTQIEQNLDSVVDHGNDDELFIASYLQGHFAVISKPLEVEPEASLEILDKAITTSLQEAFANQELEADDQQKVWTLWQQQVAQVDT